MKTFKNAICLGLLFVLLASCWTLQVFAKEENDLIYQALEYLDEGNYNKAVIELEEALALTRNKASLQLINLYFCTEDPQMFGIYNIRNNNKFTQDDMFYIYGEPKNFTYNEVQKDIYKFHFKGEIYLLDSGNNVLFGEMNFLDFPLTSHVRNTEIFISSAIQVKNLGLSAGDYKFRFIIKDMFSQKTAEAVLEFSILD